MQFFPVSLPFLSTLSLILPSLFQISGASLGAFPAAPFPSRALLARSVAQIPELEAVEATWKKQGLLEDEEGERAGSPCQSPRAEKVSPLVWRF